MSGGRSINKHLIVNAKSGLLKDTDLEATDHAAHICPTGAILIKRTGYQVPIGKRIYDHEQIDQVSLESEHHQHGE
jgi:[NiFe] hydrogenase diaphorase moiety small subunit